ncbi:MAG TPA: SPOR domain-containing protein [Cellvibrionaceae bacterium]
MALELQRLQARQQQQDQLLNELQQMQPALVRLLAIEEDLYLLIERLQALSQNQGRQATVQPSAAPAEKVEQKKQAVAVATAVKKPATTTAPPAMPIVEANFALQITSITEPHRLPEIWRQLTDKHPQLLGAMEPNFQVIRIQNTDYYRLKIGRFGSQTEASAKCADLKAAGLTCFVANYTESDFSELSR